MDRKKLNQMIKDSKKFKLSKDELCQLSFYMMEENPIIPNRFKRHYNLELILSAINQFEQHLIDNEYFESWCSVYSDIIYSYNQPQNSSNFEYFLQVRIEELINFVSNGVRKKNIFERIKNLFKFYDEIYQNSNNLEVIEESVVTIVNDIEANYLAVNHKEKICYIFFCADECEVAEESKSVFKQFKSKIKKLEEKDYTRKIDFFAKMKAQYVKGR